MIRTFLRSLVIFSLVIVDIYSVIAYYRNNSQDAYLSGLKAYDESRYDKAFLNLHLVINRFWMSYLPEIEELSRKEFESSLLVYLHEQIRAKDCLEAAGALQAYNQYSPYSSKTADLHKEVVDCFIRAAEQAHTNGDLIHALNHYNTIRSLYPNTASAEEARSLSAQLYLDMAENAWQNGNGELALRFLQVVVDQYSGLPQAEQAANRILQVHEMMGDMARAKGDYEKAIQHYQHVLSEQQVTPQTSGIGQKISQCYLEWARKARDDKNYPLAGELYSTLMVNWGDTSAARGVNEEFIQMTLEHADYALKNGDGASAIKIYRSTAVSYPNTPYARQAAEALPQAYLAHAADLTNRKDFVGAIEIYTLLSLQYAGTDYANTAAQKIDDLYIAYAAERFEQKDFTASYKIYDFISRFSLAEEIRLQAKEGYRRAVTSLSQDMNDQGKALLDLAYHQACAFLPTDSPALNMAVDQPGKGLVCNQDYTLPEDLLADKPETFRYVVIFQEGTDLLQTCSYSGVYKIYRKRYWWKFTLVDTKTGKIRVEETFYGTFPSGCPSRAVYSVGQFEKTYFGKKPEKSVTEQWLRYWFDR